MKSTLLLLSLAVSGLAGANELVIDGKSDEAIWSTAQVFDQFVAVEPYTRAKPEIGQLTRILALPEGLALAFEIEHPADVARTKPKAQRDQIGGADRVNLIIDFDNKGQTAYNFTVSLAGDIEDGIASRNSFRNDWDGDWQYAVHETADSWTVEMLVPWTITAMDPVDGPTRTVGIYLDRVLKSRGERYAYPALRFSQSDFISTFAKVEIPAYSASQSHVYPYVSALYDNVNNETKTRAGIDVFYKPSSSFQLVGALNPDFGQVESDDLVVDFSAIEVFFSDKRPFFTENNDDFILALPDSGQLIYTRRIGGNRDDGKGVADIDAAVKMRAATGNGSISYLGAQEADYNEDIGRRFQVLRPKYRFNGTQLGYLLLDTEHPFLDRHAQVQGADLESTLTDNVRFRVQALSSEIETESLTLNDRQRGQGGWLTLDINPSVDSQHTFEAVNYDEDLVLSDMGYLQRSNLRQVAWQSRFVQTGFATDALVREIEWEGKVKPRRNQQGDDIGDMARLTTRFRGQHGDYAEFEVVYQQAGEDDLISRGNGNWDAPGKTTIETFIETTRRGNSAWEFGYFSQEEGLSEPFDQFWIGYIHYFGDSLTVETEIEQRKNPDWLIWLHDNAFTRYRKDQYEAALALNWFPSEQHELRIKAQWLAIAADHGDGYALINEQMQATGVPADDLNINTFGLQLRYRYKLGSLSDLFLVYARGGFSERSDGSDSPGELFDDALSLRDADQFLVKLRLQF
jgi:hypothetical protein